MTEPDAVGRVGFRGWSTWYRVTGELRPHAAKVPVVVLNGGPGATHDYCLAMANLARGGRAVVHYDQIGCGNSTHLPEADPAFWTVELFVEELRNLVASLGIGDRFHLLGQSWGGMLASELMVADAAGVVSLTLCDTPASMALFRQGTSELRAKLPPDVQEVLCRHEEAGTTDSAEYDAAVQVFYRRHLCRIQPFPSELQASFDKLAENPTVYHTMNGPSEFHVIGSLRDWSIVERLDRIAVPTLVVAGAHDEVTSASWAPFVERIQGARSHVFQNSSHVPHIEEAEAFLSVVGAFLDEHD